MNSQEKKEILKSVYKALGEGGTIILACTSPADKNIAYFTAGSESSIAAILATMMLDDEAFVGIMLKAAKAYIHFKKQDVINPEN